MTKVSVGSKDCKHGRGLICVIGILVLCLIAVGCQKKTPKEEAIGADSAQGEVAAEATEAGGQTKEAETTAAANQTEPAKIKGENTYENPDLGFSFQYNKLMLDTESDDETYATLMHLSGDKARVTVAVPDAILEDPEAWLKKEGTTKDYKTFKDQVMTLDGYPARLNEYEVSMMGKLYHTINLTALKDGYFYTLSVLMDAAYVEDTRTEFDVVVGSFSLSNKVVNLETLELWKSEVPSDFPFDTVPFFEVASIYGVFGKSMAEDGHLDVTYVVKDGITEEEVIQFYDDLLKGTGGYARDNGRSGEEITGTLGQYAIEVQVRKNLDIQVSVDVKKK